MSENQVKIDYKVVRSDRRTTKTNEPYYALELLDSGGDKHEARIWSDVIEGRREYYLPQEGWYLGNVKSHENVFRGQKQLVIDDYRIFGSDEVHAAVKEQFVEQAVIDVDGVIARMFYWPFWDSDMAVLMEKVEEDLKRDGVWDKIRAIPAGASYHHNVRGGFLLHIDEMLNFSENLLDATTDLIKGEFVVGGLGHYPGLVDYQILRAAIVLHDIGKLYDYDEKTLQYQANPVSDCLEHTIVGILLVGRHWVEDSAESVDRGLRLKHALAAHHGPEMGAVKPKTPEAIILHHLDMMSAHLDVCRRAYDDVKKNGGSGSYSKMLGACPFIPAFFPTDISTYPIREKSDKTFVEKAELTESRSEGTEKLPWEE